MSLVSPDRSVIRLSGDDRLSFLQGLITQDIENLSADGAIFAALLTPQGKILFDFFISEDGDTLLIDCDRENAPALAKRLALYKLRAKVSIEIDGSLGVAVSEVQMAAPLAYQDPRLTALGWRAIVDAQQAADSGDYDAMRIANGVPAFGKDFGSDEVFLLDVNYDALRAVSYQKGCFVGQEVTSRMKRKGDVRKRTLIAEFDGPAADKGAAITAGDSTLGELLGGAGNAALALVRLDRWGKAKAAGLATECEGHTLSLRLPAYLEQG